MSQVLTESPVDESSRPPPIWSRTALPEPQDLTKPQLAQAPTRTVHGPVSEPRARWDPGSAWDGGGEAAFPNHIWIVSQHLHHRSGSQRLSGCRPELISPHCSMLRRLSADGTRIAPQSLQRPALASHAANSSIRRHEHLGGPRDSCEPRQRTCHCCSPSNVGQPSYRCRSTQRGSFDVAEWSVVESRPCQVSLDDPSLPLHRRRCSPTDPKPASRSKRRLQQRDRGGLFPHTTTVDVVVGDADQANRGRQYCGADGPSVCSPSRILPSFPQLDISREKQNSLSALRKPKPAAVASATCSNSRSSRRSQTAIPGSRKREPDDGSWRTKAVSRPALAHAKLHPCRIGCPGLQRPTAISMPASRTAGTSLAFGPRNGKPMSVASRARSSGAMRHRCRGSVSRDHHFWSRNTGL